MLLAVLSFASPKRRSSSSPRRLGETVQSLSCFRDELHCPDALYLDGVVSSLYSAELRRSDFKVDLGPIVGVLR
jgi:hypothetical protein